MKIQQLGHVVVNVSNLSRSEAFYRDVLGLQVCAHYDQHGMKMAFFTLGNHHDFAIMENTDAKDLGTSGLHHVAFKIGNAWQDLLDAKAAMENHGLEIEPVDHDVTKSIYIKDPDGNGVELYIDSSDAWREEPERVATAEPMAL